MDFLKSNARWLAAGILMTAASGYGQTFFISIFAGEIRSEFGLSNGKWGGIYTAGTLASAALMLFAGPLVDAMPTKRIAAIVLVLFALVCAGMAVNQFAWVLIVIIFGLRFCGQGMMGHIAMVAAGRWFAASRGKAVSIVALGFSAAEAALPIIFVALTASLGWRVSWIIAGLVTLLTIPVLTRLLAKDRVPTGEEKANITVGMGGQHWTRRKALRHWLFWTLMPATLALPIFSTATFFQQVHLSESKGWALSGFVALIPLMTAATIASMLVTGRLIDRFGSFFVVPYFLMPAVLGYVVIGYGAGLEAAALGLVLMGFSHGAYQTLGGTLWPELYGTEHLGAIRSVATSAMVFGTALGPGVSGVLIDLGLPFKDQLFGIAVIAVLCSALATFAISRVAKPHVSV